MPKKIKSGNSTSESLPHADLHEHQYEHQYDDFGEPFECLQKGNSVPIDDPKILTSDKIESIANALAIPLKTSGQRMNKKSSKTLLQNIIRVLEDF